MYSCVSECWWCSEWWRFNRYKLIVVVVASPFILINQEKPPPALWQQFLYFLLNSWIYSENSSFFRGNFHWTGHWTVWTLSRKDFLVGFKLGPIYRDLSGLETEKFSQVWFAVQWNGFWSWPFSIKYFPSSQSKIFHEFRWSSRWIKTMVEFQ